MEKIGLKAILDDKDFQKGIKNYQSSIDKTNKVNEKGLTGFSRLGQGFKDLTGFSLGAAGGIALVGVGLQKGIKFLQDSVGETIEYNKTVREMSQVTGLSADETSRLIQVGDDWGIKTGDIQSALAMMTKKGVVPSIENLANLADEYVKAKDKAIFLEEATKKYGRSVTTLIPLLAEGGDKLREQTDAVNDSLIATEASIKASREYEVAVDNLGDAWTGFKRTIGNAIIPALADLLTGLNDVNDAISEEKDVTEEYKKLLAMGLVPEIRTANAIVDEYGNVVVEATGGTAEMKKAIDDAAAAYAGATAGLVPYSDYIQNTATPIADDYADSNFRIALSIIDVNKAAFGKEALDALNKAYTDGTISADDYHNQMRFIMKDYLDMEQPAIDATIQLQDLKEKLANGQISASEYATAVLQLYNNLKLLDGTNANATVTYTTVYVDNPNAGRDYGGEGRASGGPVSAGQPYIVGEFRPELFIPNVSGYIVPSVTAPQSIPVGGGGVTLNFGNININNGSDEQAFIARVEGAVLRAMGV